MKGEMLTCGKPSNNEYENHRRRGEKPCKACRLIHNDYMRQYRWDRKAGKLFPFVLKPNMDIGLGAAIARAMRESA